MIAPPGRAGRGLKRSDGLGIMTRRNAIIALLMSAAGSARATETNYSTNIRRGGTNLIDWVAMEVNPHWKIHYDLDICDGVEVSKGGKTITITGDEIWKALNA